MSTNQESVEVQGDELFSRRTKHKGDRFQKQYNLIDPPHVMPDIFRPSDNDTTGLSIFRCKNRSDIWCAFNEGKREDRYLLAKFSYENLMKCAVESGIEDLNLVADMDLLDIQLNNGHTAHYLMGYINAKNYSIKETKMKIKSWAEKLANTITREYLIGPFQIPSNNDPYV